jgi:hypothetical protein
LLPDWGESQTLIYGAAWQRHKLTAAFSELLVNMDLFFSEIGIMSWYASAFYEKYLQ